MSDSALKKDKITKQEIILKKEREARERTREKKLHIMFKLFYIFVTPLCDMIRAHSHHSVHWKTQKLIYVS